LLISKTERFQLKTLDDFIEFYDEVPPLDFENGQLLNFSINDKYRKEKIVPFVKIANINNSINIANTFLEAYSGKYPFKVLEDSNKISQMIKNPNYIWFLFKTDSGEISGCMGVYFEFDKKRGYLFGFALKKKYQGKFDVLKTFICCLLYLSRSYNNEIKLWTSEVRTFSSTPQHANSMVSLKPIAFLPNKDIFCDNPESEFLTITYKKEILTKYRSKKKPKIIRQILNCYTYSQKRYNLSLPDIENPNVKLSQEKITNIKKNLIIRKEIDKYNQQLVKITLKNRKSFLRFLNLIENKNVEKTYYEVNNIEELSVFLEKITQFIETYKIRYFECYVSAYRPRHQKLFYNAGFKPRGYIPSFNYNPKEKVFEDMILFNYYSGEINSDIEINLIEESKKLKEKLE